MARGINPRVVLRDMVLDETEIPDDFDDATLWKIIASIVSEPPRRKRLENVSSFDDVVRLIKDSKKIIVLTGAGVSIITWVLCALNTESQSTAVAKTMS